jgi:putative ABC transport system ATP-binding protein
MTAWKGSQMSEPIVRLCSVSKSYSTDEIETRALFEVSLEIQSGAFVAISGPSGCGKSTLLNVIGLLESADGGDYWLDGQAMKSLPTDSAARLRNQKLGFIFQSFNLIAGLTVFENVELPLLYRGELDRSQRKEAVGNALAQVGMDHRTGHFPAQLSGGQQQRVAIARALVGKPRLLLADEPTGNLDSRSADGVLGLLQDLNRSGTTICMVTHDPRHAGRAHRRINMLDGRIAVCAD